MSFEIKNILQLLKEYNYPLKSGLNYNNEFTFIIAILLSAQSKDAFINTQTNEFFSLYNSPEKMIALGLDGIYEYIKKIGLWRNKGQNILKLSNQIIEFKKIKNENKEKIWFEKFDHERYFYDDLKIYGEILSKEGLPSFRAGLVELAGIGRKSANVFLNVIYNAPVFPVDTHFIRVSNRLNFTNSKNPVQIEMEMMELISDEYAREISHYFVWHGRNVCKAIKPDCENCKLKNACSFFQNKLK